VLLPPRLLAIQVLQHMQGSNGDDDTPPVSTDVSSGVIIDILLYSCFVLLRAQRCLLHGIPFVYEQFPSPCCCTANTLYFTTYSAIICAVLLPL
jgi:hypothetical protein